MKSIALVLLAIAACSCTDERKSAAVWANEKRIIELNGQLELAQFKLEQTGYSEPGTSQEPSEASNTRLRQEIQRLAKSKQQLRAGIASMKDEWEDHRRFVLKNRRSELSGKSFANISIDRGETFREATITSIDDGGVSIRHVNGTARLSCDDLSPGEQAYFGLDRELAAEFHQIERRRLHQYDTRLAEQLAVLEKQEKELARDRQREEERRESQQAIAAAQLRTSLASTGSLSSSIGKLGETSFFSNRSYSRYSSSYTSRPRTRYVHYYNTSPYCPPATNRYTPNIRYGCQSTPRQIGVFPNR